MIQQYAYTPDSLITVPVCYVGTIGCVGTQMVVNYTDIYLAASSQQSSNMAHTAHQ